VLKVKERDDRPGTWQIYGKVQFSDGTESGFLRQTAAGASSRKEAERAAANLTQLMLKQYQNGEDSSARPFTDALELYINDPQVGISRKERKRFLRLVTVIPRDWTLAQARRKEEIIKLKPKMFPYGAVADATYIRFLVTPIRAVLNYAADELEWCEPPRFKRMGKQPEGRTNFLTPADARRLIDAAIAPHAKSLFTFLIGTGARTSEAVYLDWSAVDLVGRKVTLFATRTNAAGETVSARKQGKRHVLENLPPIVMQTLKQLREIASKDGDGNPIGRVFRWALWKDGEFTYHNYADKEGSQFRNAFLGALQRSGLDPSLTPHDMRHTWASWHYALHKDLLKLKLDGAWSSVSLVERYAHVMPAGQEAEIRAFLDGNNYERADEATGRGRWQRPA
jgi:integrase